MKQKLFVIAILLSLLVVNFGTASAQEKTPSDSLWYSADISRGPERKGTKSGDPVVPASNAPVVQSAAGSNLAAVTSPIINGDFEKGRNVGWSENSNHGYPIVTSNSPVPPHSGSWVAFLNSGELEGYTDTTLTQANISIVAPTTLRFSYWSASQDDCGYDYAYVKFNSTIIYSWSVCYDNNTYGWQTMELSLNGYSGQTGTLSIELITDAEGWWSSMLVDDVYLYGTFVDVPYGHMFWKEIEAFYQAGITTGCSQNPKMYCPLANVNRGEMAVFLERAMGNFAPAPNPTGMFTDVPYPGQPAAFQAFIEEFYNDGITTGCSPNPLKYCPQNNVTRGEMAVFIERALGNFVPAPGQTGMFADVPNPNQPPSFKPFIEQFFLDGITTGCAQNPLRYCPMNKVTRQEMAVFIVRAFGIPLP